MEEVGRNVTEFAVGNEVFGGANGAFAQYVMVKPKSIAAKPQNVSFDEAAAVPIAAFTALQALRDKGALTVGQKVLINGAAGGVGTMAVQIAKAFGAEVTAVCSTRNLDMVSSIGADHVIDYTQEDFTKGTPRYDLFIDNIGNRSLMASKRVLSPEGIYVLVGGPKARFLGPLIRLVKALVIFAPSKKRAAPLLASQNKADLAVISSLLAEGNLKPVLDQSYPLEEAAAALDHLGGGHAQGKILIVL
jgi:NADPH:quinone reductase-like Zn-dependent oxidoreductase